MLNTSIELKNLQYVESMQPLDFTEANDLPICMTWQAICDELNIVVGNASARVKLEQAIRQAQKGLNGNNRLQSDNLRVGNSLIPQQNNDLAAIIAQSISQYIKPQEQVINEDAIIELIKLHSNTVTKETVISVNNEVSILEGRQHEKFEDVLKMIAAGLHVYLYGDAGTGKTLIAERAAQALNKNFYAISVCSQSTKSDLLGYMDAHGKYVETLFRKAYEQGGVYLIDEIDNGNPNILAVMNAALSNGYCAFPDGMIKKHEDFICIAAANTFGTGANRMFVGRNQLDAATLNRFVQIEIGYDEALESEIFNKSITKKVQAIRAKLQGERVIISMRNILNAQKLLSVGYTETQAIDMAVIQTIPNNLRNRV